MTDVPAIEVKGLRHSFDGGEVLKGIDLKVEQGQVVALMGSSGGGKTTLLRCISGLNDIQVGQVTINGVSVKEDPELAREHMGMVFQSAALFDSMTVNENLLFGLERRGKVPKARRAATVQDALLKVGLRPEDGTKMPAELSGGMRKRVGIARAVILEPSVMLFDEPTTGLDPITTFTIDTLIHALTRDLKMASLVVSHDVTSVYRTANLVGFLHQGELVFSGSTEDFRACPHPAIREMVDKATAQDLSNLS